MNESIKKYMKVGLIHFMSYPECIKGEGPVFETIKKIAVDDYFDAIEVTWIKDDAIRAKTAQMLEQSGICVAYGGQPRLLTTGYNINDLNEEGRLTALASLKEGIDQAYEMNATGFAFLAGKYEEATKEESYKQLIKSTTELCKYAKSKGNIKIVTEVFDYDVDKKSLIGPTPIAKRFAEDITKEWDNFGLLVDLSHIPLMHETIAESIYPIKDYIVHAHIGTCVMGDAKSEAYGDAHPRFNFKNSINSAKDVTEFIRALMDIGYFEKFDRPILSFEIKPWGDEDRDVVVANCKRVLNEAWAAL